ncbi:MAG: hypothetical protein ABSA02_24070 [Trebonia sp.]
MLRPQGLFQSPWQQPWATPPVNGGMPAGGPTPPPPAGGPYQGGGQYPAGNQQQPFQTEAPAQPGTGYPGGGPATPPGQYPPGQYPPGPYPPGPYQPGIGGQGQYAPGQQGPGQYAPGQFTQGLAPVGQYGPGGQYGTEQFSQGAQYAPGQYSGDQYATGQYGPGGQYGPDGTPIADQKRPLTFGKITLPRSPLVPAVVIAALVVIVVTAVWLSASGGSGSSPGTAAGGTTPTAASSATASTNGEQLQAATSLSGLLAQSGTDRNGVIDAVTNVQRCGSDLGQDAQIFRKDAANRRTLLAKLQVMPGRSALSGAMLSDLTGGWEASAKVDDDLAKWATAAAAHCKGGDKNNPSLQASYAFDGPATNDKVAFTKLWNPLAREDGLPTYQNTQI